MRVESFCVVPDTPLAGALSALTEEDIVSLKELGWPGFHLEDLTHCVSGCSHCMVCEPGCSADWGLYF